MLFEGIVLFTDGVDVNLSKILKKQGLASEKIVKTKLDRHGLTMEEGHVTLVSNEETETKLVCISIDEKLKGPIAIAS